VGKEGFPGAKRREMDGGRVEDETAEKEEGGDEDGRAREEVEWGV
jgi:hypothetical protein